MYYGILSIAVVMFSFQFYLNQKFERIKGHGLRAAAAFLFLSSCFGVLILLVVNRFRLEFTPFTLLISLWTALNYILYNICSIRALGKINLSLFSLFTTLGGMILPFAAGLLIFHETLTAGKICCFIAVFLALLLGANTGLDRQGWIYYAGVFVSNGMVGVLAKVFEASHYEKTSSAAYSMTVALVLALVSGIYLLLSRERLPETEPAQTAKALGFAAGYGILNNIGNLLMLISLAHVSASAQYPMTTGGMIIVSTVLCCFTKDKPNKKEIAAVIIAFAGILLLVTLP